VEIADLSQDAGHLHVGNSQIQHDGIRACGAKEFQAFSATLSEHHMVAMQTEPGMLWGETLCCMTEGCEQALERVCQYMHRAALDDKLADPESTDLPLRLRGTVSTQNDHRLFRILAAYLLEDRDSIHPRHFQIKHHDSGVFSLING
jgi:hypothetical protein